MGENFGEIREYLLYLRQKESGKLDELYRAGKLRDYLLQLNKEMISKYPEMIERVYSEEEIEQGPGGV